ncbi:MAG: hypothetical protein A2V84_13975 [Chloroflexi bacterium RBG_16_70_13]|nr:MAG: hypothetical protein A2V84_13975 [Chloroflexi bacterium RBG_16_70_13]
MTDHWDAPPAPGACPWCSATNPPEARQCASCGAAIAQRDDLGGVVVPGVTGVDPNLLGTPSSLASPMLRGQGTLGALNAVSQVNATLGLAAAAAYLGQDTIKGMLGGHDADLETVGKPSEAALQALARLEGERDAAKSPSGDGRVSGDGPVSGDEPVSGDGPQPVVDPWSDLPSG